MKVTYCGSVPAYDGRDVDKQIGWFYGVHFVDGEREEMVCPRCKIELGRAAPPDPRGSDE